MAWEWKEDTFKGAIAIVLAWCGSYLAKRFRPGIRYVKAWFKMKDSVLEIKQKSNLTSVTQMALMDIDKHPIFICNSKLEFIYVNRAFLKMTGMRGSKEAMGFGFLASIPEQNKEMVIDQWERIKEHPSSISTEITFVNVENEELIQTLCMMEPIYEEGNFFQIIGRIYVI